MADNFADSKAPVCMLSAKSFFDQLTTKEQLYAHYMTKASHWGTRVVLRQVSHESESIFDFLIAVHKACGGDYSKLPLSNTKEYLEYASMFLANLGNYSSFGDNKFVPRVPQADMLKVAEFANVTLSETTLKGLYDETSLLLGFPSEGHTSGYYFGDVNKDDMEALKGALQKHKILPENLRIKKNSPQDFEILVASASNTHCSEFPESVTFEVNGKPAEAKIVFGDHSREMAKIAEYLGKAKENAANETQVKMLDSYIASFTSGSGEQHKESQRHWVKDLGPVIETNVGFIETYREPSGIIGEWESLVAITNKERTKKFSALVDNAKDFIKELPWPADFEKPVFTPPDFTSLEVLTFNGSGIPAGINIPNYDDIRLNVGFKNVSLGNILNARSGSEPLTFVADEDQELFNKLKSESFEVQVGIHELLGHGSGKLLCENADGTFNFDTLPEFDGEKITSYYKKGETWGSVFGGLAGPYEECRAELIGCYLCLNRDLLSIFGFTDKKQQDDIIYINWLSFVRAGLLALQFYDPETKKWGQPHMQARFSILRTFLLAGEDFVQLKWTKDDFSDLHGIMDRTKIETVGKKAVEDYLKHLHIYKSTGNFTKGEELFGGRSSVPEELGQFRNAVLAARLPRKQYIQANTVINGDSVELREYEESELGMIESFIEREY